MTAKKIRIQDGDSLTSEEEAALRDADLSSLNGEESAQHELSTLSEHAPEEPAIVAEQVGQDAVESSLVEQELRSEVEEFRTKYLRSLADFENFKKRTQKERSDLLKYQGEKILLDFVEVLDNLELALSHSDADPATLREGVDLIYKQFEKVFEKWEVRSKPGVGAPFDPNHQNALSRLPSQEHDPGTVVNELKKTYFYKDRLLRPGEVVVAAEASAPTEE
ncbi:MAG: nucleotide exchange factor GrpE [Bdellovibrionales bacterium]|nr:nucleotide exchange factor GrpE [Bdellovibrionales bacterium]